MAYIGNTVENQNYVPAIDYFNGDGSTVAFTLSRPVASVAAVQAVISNVPQNPGSAFTVSGSTITFTSAPPSGTANIYVYYTSPNTQVVQPGQGTVGTVQIADGSVTPAKLSTGAPTWDTSGNVATTGNIVINNSNADGGQLTLCSAGYDNWNVDSYSGTLRFYNGSTVRASIDSSGRVTTPYQPAFSAWPSGGDYVSTQAVIPFNSASVNVGSCFDTSTYRFTAPVTGTYMFVLSIYTRNQNSTASAYPQIRKNGARQSYAYNYHPGFNGSQDITLTTSVILSMSASDYVDSYWGDSTTSYYRGSAETVFNGFLLG